ncbi:Uncharacterised protein [Mycobacteroides abscessus subsp. bolletii]|jgi:hypothetical protein|nr:Uncharacterised protein [Mycobacteroides abscessus subsp. bolletii]SKX25537.1 Uncharacterised protein [Mycobacteroides abscessus subsp. bolletii]
MEQIRALRGRDPQTNRRRDEPDPVSPRFTHINQINGIEKELGEVLLDRVEH